jgi:hypothetical protein
MNQQGGCALRRWSRKELVGTLCAHGIILNMANAVAKHGNGDVSNSRNAYVQRIIAPGEELKNWKEAEGVLGKMFIFR